MPKTIYRGLEVQVTGTNPDQWGNVLNNQGIVPLDNYLGRVVTIPVSGATMQLTADQTQTSGIVFTNNLTQNCIISPGPGVLFNGGFFIANRTTGNFWIGLSNGVGDPLLVPQGTIRQILSDQTSGINAIGLPPPGTFLDLGAQTPHPSLIATSGGLRGEYLLCDGSPVARTGNTAALFQAIGTQWGSGDGSTTFNLPDLRGRGRFGKDNMGGSSANRITPGGSGITGSSVGNTGGQQSRVLNQGNLPNVTLITTTDGAHLHPYRRPDNPTSIQQGGSGSQIDVVRDDHEDSTGSAGAHNHSVPLGGSNDPFGIMPPTAIVNVLIKV